MDIHRYSRLFLVLSLFAIGLVSVIPALSSRFVGNNGLFPPRFPYLSGLTEIFRPKDENVAESQECDGK